MASLSSRLVTALLIVARVKHRRGNPSQVEQYVREHTVRPAVRPATAAGPQGGLFGGHPTRLSLYGNR